MQVNAKIVRQTADNIRMTEFSKNIEIFKIAAVFCSKNKVMKKRGNFKTNKLSD